MTIRMPEGPDNAVQLLAEGLANIRAHRTVARAFSAGEPSAAGPIPVYVLDTEGLDSGGLQLPADPAGWRFLISTGEDSQTTADLATGETGALEFQGINQGQLARRLTAALHVAEEVAGDEPEETEIRVLEVLPVYVAALWLHGTSDRFIAFMGAAQREILSVETRSEFLERVATLLRARLAASRDAGPASG